MGSGCHYAWKNGCFSHHRFTRSAAPCLPPRRISLFVLIGVHSWLAQLGCGSAALGLLRFFAATPLVFLSRRGAAGWLTFQRFPLRDSADAADRAVQGTDRVQS